MAKKARKKGPEAEAPLASAENDGQSFWGRQFPFFYSIFLFVRSRIVQGIFLILPIAVTFWILHWLYRTARDYVIDPIAYFVARYLLGQEIFYATPSAVEGSRPVVADGGPATGDFAITAGATPTVVTDSGLPPWIENFVAPLIAVAIVLGLLYFLGMFFQSRLHRAVDWILLRVPVVTTIYSAVRKLVESLQQAKGENKRFERIVLVEFPHPGMKTPGFVTSSCIDAATGKTILCIYVPTTPIPTSGYMLLAPEDEVIDLDWDLNETLAAIVSGGITTPDHVTYWNASQLAAMQAAVATTPVRKTIQGSTPRPASPGGTSDAK